MCGFAGLLDLRRARSDEELTRLADAMAAELVHRGPDDGGSWVDASAGVALGSRRLAVIDLSAEGHQPMQSASGRLVLAYNGEIYNFEKLRAKLERSGRRFRGGSDTEVLLEALEAWGVEQALRELNGMFAFALWDRSERTLYLARDRVGEKPLYYGWCGATLLFGSELKALRAVPNYRPPIDRSSLARYLGLGRVPAPYSIYEGVSQLLPGSVLTIRPDTSAGRGPSPERYWSAFDVAASGFSSLTRCPPEDVTEELDRLLGEAVGMRMHADVPVGVFLSGGVDSSTVAALMQARSSSKVRSFTIGFEDAAYDESASASAVAAHLGTDHTDLRLTPADAMQVIERMPVVYDEPFADASQIPTYLVSRLAREHVTVSLSGDGGDELFGGYNRHVYAAKVLRGASVLPRSLRTAIARGLMLVPPSRWDDLFERARVLLPARARLRLPGLKIQKLASILGAESSQRAYHVLASTWVDPRGLVQGLGDVPSSTFGDVPTELDDVSAQMMYLDLVHYLPDDILVKLDRASMAVSLESRVPMLDHRVVEFAWTIPTALKIREGGGKWILRQVLRRYLPDELVNRPKAGFGLPIGSWLRGPLRPWAEELLAPDRLQRDGYLEPLPVRKCWEEHLSGRRDLESQLWAVLMFQCWREAYPV